MKGLVVDDSETVRLMVTSQIRRAKESHDVLEVGEPSKVLDAFREFGPDVVFLDMSRGQNVDGLSLLRTMFALRPGTHVVLITALPPENPQVTEALSVGAFAYLRTPIRLGAVEGVLRDIEDETGHLRRVR